MTITDEIWAEVPGFNGSLMASTLGRLKGSDGRSLAPYRRPDGYMAIHVMSPSGRVLRTVHRLVLEAFVGPRQSGHQARHLNGRRDDNRLCNLRWGTPRENASDRARHGTENVGVRNPNRKLSAADVSQMRAMVGTLKSIAAHFGVSESHASNIRSGRFWK